MAVKVFIGGAPGAIVDFVVAVCQRQGFQALVCEDMTSAEAVIAQQTADLVCLAHYLVDGTAFELCRMMRKQPEWQGCPIVLITDGPRTQLIEKAFATGFNKTFSLEQQNDALASFIARSGAYNRAVSGHVLVVEDSRSLRRLVSSTLRGAGLQVTSFDQAPRALEAHQHRPFDLIITDVVLEGDQTGLDLITEVRSLEGDAGDVPIIVMSSYQSAAQRLEPLRIGADDYVSKPVDGEELVVRARRLIESYKLYQQVCTQQQELEHNNRMIKQMLSRVSHECRNSVNIVLGISNLMQKKNDLSAELQRKTDTIVNATRHQLSLLNDILDYTRFESGNIECELKSCAVTELVQEAVSLFRYACEEKGIALECSVAESLPAKCELDERLVKQILINLLSNAVKFVAQGAIRVEAGASEGRLIIAVRDTGPGISDNELTALFTAFKQTCTGRNSGVGTGLGLSLCAGFAHIMDGELTVQSQVNEGSVFTLALPLIASSCSSVVEL